MNAGTFDARQTPWRSDLGWLLASLALHVVLVVALLQVAGIDPRTFFRSSPPAAERAKAKAQLAAPAAGTDTLIEVKPFEGISWEEYTKRKADRSRQETTANAVLAKLKGLKFGSGTGGAAPTTAKAPSAAAPIEMGSSGSSGATLGAMISRQEYAVRRAEVTAKEGVRKMTDAERAELKKHFRELEREFRKAFAQALNDDPELRVTVAFEAEVQKNGYLKVRSFRPKGRYRQASIEQIKGAMSRSIGSVLVAPDLAGTVLRGESVFVK